MDRKEYNLDVEAPDEVAYVLRRIAEKYRDSGSELESAWQDESAGRPWNVIADILDNAAQNIDKGLAKIGYPSV